MPDPANQFQWLDDVLTETASNGSKVKENLAIGQHFCNRVVNKGLMNLRVLAKLTASVADAEFIIDCYSIGAVFVYGKLTTAAAYDCIR